MPDADAPLDLTPVAAPLTKRRNRARSIGVLVVLALAVIALLSQGILHSLNYFETVDQALHARAKLGVSNFRLEGVVKAHTITRTSTGASFWITGSHGHEVFVTATGIPPQLFQANIPVVVVGHFTTTTSDDFDSTQIMVKHSSSYIVAHPQRVKASNGTTR